jgi:hypothetical protein
MTRKQRDHWPVLRHAVRNLLRQAQRDGKVGERTKDEGICAFHRAADRLDDFSPSMRFQETP